MSGPAIACPARPGLLRRPVRLDFCGKHRPFRCAAWLPSLVDVARRACRSGTLAVAAPQGGTSCLPHRTIRRVDCWENRGNNGRDERI